MVMNTKFTTINKASELIGYSQNAIRCKIKQGVWLKNIHWVKAPDGRVLLNLDKIERWILGHIEA